MRYLSLLFVLFLCTCAPAPKTKLIVGEALILPQPLSQVTGEGYFELRNKLSYTVDQPEYAQHLLAFLSRARTQDAVEGTRAEKSPDIQVTTDSSLPDEGYTLEVSPTGISISAGTEAGVFYACKTLEQLLPVDGALPLSDHPIRFGIPTVSITDKPRFGWRGYMLDVSRHFFTVEEVKRVLDMAAGQKMNRFHWHLTDDQGWRIEIKSRPLLTQVGAWRADRTNTDENISDWWGRAPLGADEKPTYGGFYTQEEIRDIVAYAKARFIEIVPEIDMPGHAQAAVAAYPEIGAVNAATTVATGGVFKNNTLNPGKEATYAFANDVLNEVMDLFPFNYLHIGGDECNKSQWKVDPDAQQTMRREGLKNEEELQSYFIRLMEEIVNARGKTLIGWDEILEGGLAPNAVVMSWRGDAGGIAAATAGHPVIMTPNNHCYVDLKQGNDDEEPNLGYSRMTLTDAYNNPVIPEELNEEQAKFVLGTQANMWTESISDWSKFTYMNYPRVYAIAECAWTAPARKNWDDFTNRVYHASKRLDAQGIRHAVSAFSPWAHHEETEDGIRVWFETEANGLDIRYTLDGSDPDTSAMLFNEPFVLKSGEVVVARAFRNGEAVGYQISPDFRVHPTAGSKVTGTDGKAYPELSDQQFARLTPVDSNWIRFGDEAEFTVDFGAAKAVSSLAFNTLRYTISGIYPPTEIEVFGLREGADKFTSLNILDRNEQANQQGRNKLTSRISFSSTTLTKLRVRLKTHRPIPAGHHRAGGKGRLFVDELVVE